MGPIENSEATSTPTSYPKEIDKCIDPSPSLSDTDCTTWSFLHSLIMVANNMDNEGEMVDVTKVELDRLDDLPPKSWSRYNVSNGP